VIRFFGIELTTHYAPVSRITGAFVVQRQRPIENSEGLHNCLGDAVSLTLATLELRRAAQN